MNPTPHLDKLNAAIGNPKCAQDVHVLAEGLELYERWIDSMSSLASTGKTRVEDMVALLNWYKQAFEVNLIMRKGSGFLYRQKGQLKLDNTILEEFLTHLVSPSILEGLANTQFEVGPHNAFMALSFHPHNFGDLDDRPEVIIKSKDQDFVIGAKLHYKFSPTPDFEPRVTSSGSFVLAVVAAECKVNLDKTMYQEAAGTAERLKQGCPVAKYFLVVEYLDMTPEDCRLTKIDNVFLLRRVKRLPFGKRHIPDIVENYQKDHPIDPEVIWRFVQEIQVFVNAVWFDPNAALSRGTFV